MTRWPQTLAWSLTLITATGAVGALFANSLALSQSKSASADSPVTFNRDIAPIVFHYCASCHRPGEAGPFPLLTYADVKKHAHQIADVTRRAPCRHGCRNRSR